MELEEWDTFWGLITGWIKPMTSNEAESKHTESSVLKKFLILMVLCCSKLKTRGEIIFLLMLLIHFAKTVN